MKVMQFRDVQAKLAAVVDDALAGEATTITRDGAPVAVVMPVAAAEQTQPRRKTFGQHLLEFPGGIEFERDQSPPREIDL